MYKHRFDPVSFVFGMAFVAVALLFVVPGDPWEIYFGGMSLGWVWPLLAILAGLAILAPALRSGSTDAVPGSTVDSDADDHSEAEVEPSP